MNKSILAIVAAQCLTCTVSLSMNLCGDSDDLDGILTPAIVATAQELSSGTICIIDADETLMEPKKLMDALTISSQDKIPEGLKVTVNWPQLKGLLPSRVVIKEAQPNFDQLEATPITLSPRRDEPHAAPDHQEPTPVTTPLTILQATRLNNITPQKIIIINASDKENSHMANAQGLLKEALTVSSGDTHTELSVTFDWLQLRKVIPVQEVIKEIIVEKEVIRIQEVTKKEQVVLKPTLLQKLTDPVTLATAAAAGLICYYLAKNNNE